MELFRSSLSNTIAGIHPVRQLRIAHPARFEDRKYISLFYPSFPTPPDPKADPTRFRQSALTDFLAVRACAYPPIQTGRR